VRQAVFLDFNLLGDLLCTTAALRAFRQRYQDALVVYIVPNAPHYRLLEDNPDIDFVLYREDLLAYGEKIVNCIWLRSLPLEFDDESYLLRLGVGTLHDDPGVFDNHLAHGFARLLELDLDSVRPRVSITDKDRRIAATYIRKPYIIFSMHTSSPVVGPGGAMVRKDWVLERWLELARRLGESSDYDIIAMGSAPELPVMSRCFRNLYGLPIKVAAAIVEQAACVVTGESGFFHLCQAADAPMVLIYSRDIPVPWAYPYEASNCRVMVDDLLDGNRARVLEDDAASRRFARKGPVKHQVFRKQHHHRRIHRVTQL